MNLLDIRIAIGGVNKDLIQIREYGNLSEHNVKKLNKVIEEVFNVSNELDKNREKMFNIHGSLL